MINSLNVAYRDFPVRQRGISLIVVLMLLVVVSLLGIASMQIVMMGERAARSDRDMQLAWQGAEAALVDAEIELQGPNNFANSRTQKIRATGPVVVSGCNDDRGWRGFCSFNSSGGDSNKPTWLTVDFSNVGGRAPSIALGTFTGRSFNNAGTAAGRGIQPALAPRYIVEYIPPADDPGNLSKMVTGGYTSASSDETVPAAAGSLYRVTGIGFGPRRDVQAVLQTVYRN